LTHLIFYEKPDCGGNARQRALLEAAGHTLTRRSLVGMRWSREELLAFLQGLPVAQWFNRAAPRVKNGDIVPEAIDSLTAIDMLLAEPLLIRRPLMQREDGARLVGFDIAEVDRFVGLGSQAPARISLEGCAAAMRGCRAAESGSN